MLALASNVTYLCTQPCASIVTAVATRIARSEVQSRTVRCRGGNGPAQHASRGTSARISSNV